MQTDGMVTKIALRQQSKTDWLVTATVEWQDNAPRPDGGNRTRERTLKWKSMCIDGVDVAVLYVEHDYAKHVVRAKGELLVEGNPCDDTEVRHLFAVAGRQLEVTLTERQPEPELPF